MNGYLTTLLIESQRCRCLFHAPIQIGSVQKEPETADFQTDQMQLSSGLPLTPYVLLDHVDSLAKAEVTVDDKASASLSACIWQLVRFMHKVGC